MNFADSDYEAISKYVSNSAIYKQCGNSIVVSCLVAIMSSLFVKDGYKADVWTEYMLNYDD
jgi:site-specific DNA-cytosine methylase